jgi:hypothetical protein
MMNLCILPYTMICNPMSKKSCVKLGCYLNIEEKVNLKVLNAVMNMKIFSGVTLVLATWPSAS